MAIGMVEVEGVAGIVVAADAACKSAEVELLGWDSIGGFTTVFFIGSISAVAAALRSGEEAARQVSKKVSAAALNQPEPACFNYVTVPVKKEIAPVSGALGLLETQGYGLQVLADDRMVKAAQVEVANVLTVHNRVVCSLIIGEVGAVKEALAVGRELAAASSKFLGSAFIAQPVPQVLQAFGRR
ncbi:MAG: BMC domain-containing protein [Candidatus Latescibacteria bacterium]|nr:BMC domain-containing protein [Candidatus Latescibacterota bacterium]